MLVPNMKRSNKFVLDCAIKLSLHLQISRDMLVSFSQLKFAPSDTGKI
jgi:hypothetical protein